MKNRCYSLMKVNMKISVKYNSIQVETTPLAFSFNRDLPAKGFFNGVR